MTLPAEEAYAGNAEFNSDPTQKVVGTLGFAAEKLATPTELAAADVTSSGAKISWAEVSGAANYRVVVKTTSDGNEVSSAVVSATSYTASGLKAGTDYTVSVHKIDYAASGGIHKPDGIVKAILAGASAIEICSAIYQNTNLFIGEMNRFLSAWMERKGFKHISQFKGKLNAKDVGGINMFERTQFLKYFSEK